VSSDDGACSISACDIYFRRPYAFNNVWTVRYGMVRQYGTVRYDKYNAFRMSIRYGMLVYHVKDELCWGMIFQQIAQ